MPANLMQILKCAHEALLESYDDVMAALEAYVDHPANTGKRRLIQEQLGRHARATALVGQQLQEFASAEEKGRTDGMSARTEERFQMERLREPEFTDEERQALMWLLAMHMETGSGVGEMLRYLLGMGSGEPLSRVQLESGASWQGKTASSSMVLPDGMPPRLLTELAAEAMGLELEWAELHQLHWIALGQGLEVEPWNPITDDRVESLLETNLSLSVKWLKDAVRVGGHTEPFDRHGGDRQAARRYAGTAGAAMLALASRVVTGKSEQEVAAPPVEAEPKRCAAGSDGDCMHRACPQMRDGEPQATGRHCPLDAAQDQC